LSLLSEASSDVLFSLILGLTNPKVIAEHIGDSPPSVVEQLNKLREEGYVKRGEKEGKYQPYLINWDRLVYGAIQVAPLLIDGLVTLNTAGRGEEGENKIKALRQNAQLRSFIRGFMEAVARRESSVDVYQTYRYRAGGGSPLRGWRTFNELMRDFEHGLLFMFPKLERGKFQANSMLELYDGLKLWNDFCELALQRLVAKPFKDEIQRALSERKLPT